MTRGAGRALTLRMGPPDRASLTLTGPRTFGEGSPWCHRRRSRCLAPGVAGRRRLPNMRNVRIVLSTTQYEFR
jgi:hypothetical protein